MWNTGALEYSLLDTEKEEMNIKRVASDLVRMQ
jgi:hypothetical protein